MNGLILRGKVVNIREENTAKGTGYRVIVVEQRKSNGDPVITNVMSWSMKNDIEVGAEMELPIYVRAYVNKRGYPGVQYVLLDGGINAVRR